MLQAVLDKVSGIRLTVNVLEMKMDDGFKEVNMRLGALGNQLDELDEDAQTSD